MKMLNKVGDFFRKVYRRIRPHLNLGKKELIIVLSSVAAAGVVIALVVVFKISSSHKAPAQGNYDISLAEEDVDIVAEGDEIDEEDIPVVETATEGTKIESTEDTTVLPKKEGAKKGYLNRCVFLGDSRTVAMVNYGFFNDDAALAQIGISHPSFEKNTFINNAGKEYTMKSYLESHQAPVIYIALGVNGINDPSEEHYKETFRTLVDHVADMAPNSNIVLMAIGPVDDNGTYKKTVQNAWVDKYNAFLLDMAKEKHIFYLDIAEILKGSDGQVKAEYDAGDGLHYSGSGCEAIFNYIVEHPVPGIPDDGEYVVKYIKPNPNRTKVTMDDGSGIDQDKLQDLMNMMMEGSSSTKTSSSSSADAAALQAQKEREEAQRREEEEKKRREEEEKKRREEEERRQREKEEEEARKASEASEAAAREAARQAAEAASRQAEAARQAEQSGGGQSQPSGGNESPSQPSEQQPEQPSEQQSEQPSESQPEPSPEPSESPSEDNSSGEG